MPGSSTRPLKSTAKEWAGSKRAAQKFRDRKVITLPDGTKREFFGYGHSKTAAAQDLYAKIQAEEHRLTTLASVDTITQVMAKLARHKRSVRGRKRKTIYNDLELFKLHVQPTIGRIPITDVKLHDLEQIQTRLTGEGKYRTAEMATILLKSLYKQALRHYRADIRTGRLALYNLAEDLEPIRRPAEAKHRPNDPWTVEELGVFLQVAKAHYDASRKHLMYPLLHTAIASGLRRGELLGLRRSDLVTVKRDDGSEAHHLVVRRQLVYYDGRHHKDTPKSASGERRVPIGAELVDVLRAHMTKLDDVAAKNPEWEPTNLLFPSHNGRPTDPRNIYRARDTLLVAAGKELKRPLPKATLHELRGLYATYVTRELVRQGRYSPKLVMQLLGHAHPNVALQHYNRVVEEDLDAALFDPTPAKSVPGEIPVLESSSAPQPSDDEQRDSREVAPVTTTD